MDITVTFTEKELETAIDALNDRAEQTRDALNNDPTYDSDTRHELEKAEYEYSSLATRLAEQR